MGVEIASRKNRCSFGWLSPSASFFWQSEPSRERLITLLSLSSAFPMWTEEAPGLESFALALSLFFAFFMAWPWKGNLVRSAAPRAKQSDDKLSELLFRVSAVKSVPRWKMRFVRASLCDSLTLAITSGMRAARLSVNGNRPALARRRRLQIASLAASRMASVPTSIATALIVACKSA